MFMCMRTQYACACTQCTYNYIFTHTYTQRKSYLFMSIYNQVAIGIKAKWSQICLSYNIIIQLWASMQKGTFVHIFFLICFSCSNSYICAKCSYGPKNSILCASFCEILQMLLMCNSLYTNLHIHKLICIFVLNRYSALYRVFQGIITLPVT